MWYESVKCNLGYFNLSQAEQSEAKQPYNPKGKLKKNQKPNNASVLFSYRLCSDVNESTH